jgi:hypothetical protein
MPKSRDIIDAVVEGHHYPVEDEPPRAGFTSPEEDTAFYTKNPFLAYNKALELGRHDDRFWRAIRGSVYEKPYAERFFRKSRPAG